MAGIAQLFTVLRPAVLVVLGAVIGAGVAPVMAGAHPQATVATTTQTRAASCQGLNFHPADSETTDAFQGPMLYRTDDGAGSGFFVCDPSLPNRAVVKQVQFTVFDNSSTFDSVDNCGLYRSSLRKLGARSYDELALVPSSGPTETPGIIRLSDTTIKHATIDNTRYGYLLQCKLSVSGRALGIFGADVIYAISSANG